MSNDRVTSLKEYVIKLLKRQIKYHTFQALDNISIEVEKGQVIGILGRNGAGKSTLLKVVAGILKPYQGSITVDARVVPMLELGSGFDHDLTGRENVFLNGAILGYSRKYLTSKFEEIYEFSGLGEFIDVPIRNYSSGMLIRLAFSIATVVQPEILIVDEILSVGDENFKKKSKNRMVELMSGGTTVFFVSHDLAQIEEICDKALWLEKGKMMIFDDTHKVVAEYRAFMDKNS